MPKTTTVSTMRKQFKLIPQHFPHSCCKQLVQKSQFLSQPIRLANLSAAGRKNGSIW
jgi:hypothetical protein